MKKYHMEQFKKGDGENTFKSVLNVFNQVWTWYSGKTKQLPTFDLPSTLFMEISQLITIPGIMQYPVLMLTHFVGQI